MAEKLRSEYDFGHTLDAKFLPRGEAVKKPTVRLFKPFDELIVDFEARIALFFCCPSPWKRKKKVVNLED